MRKRQTVLALAMACGFLLAAPAADAAVTIPANEQAYYTHTDSIGRMVEVTDSSGAAVWRQNIEPFGEGLLNDDVQGTNQHFRMPLRFPGQYYDLETLLSYNWHRHYRPTWGRYLEPDPLSQLTNQQYQYAYNNPHKYLDEPGLFPYEFDETVTNADNNIKNTIINAANRVDSFLSQSMNQCINPVTNDCDDSEGGVCDKCNNCMYDNSQYGWFNRKHGWFYDEYCTRISDLKPLLVEYKIKNNTNLAAQYFRPWFFGIVREHIKIYPNFITSNLKEKGRCRASVLFHETAHAAGAPTDSQASGPFTELSIYHDAYAMEYACIEAGLCQDY